MFGVCGPNTLPVMLLRALRRQTLLSVPLSAPQLCRGIRSRAGLGGGEVFGDEGGSDEEGGGGGDERGSQKRRGREFVDPLAPRRVEAIRNDPMNAAWGGMIDIIEHHNYCDVQREENEEGFFFDNTRPEFDSDEDGDPFANAYLTEDEYEFPEEYKPSPYVPGRVMDAIWYAHTTKGVPITRLVEQFAMPSHKITAIINLKANEPKMKASGRYDERLDAQLSDLYSGRFGTPVARPHLSAEATYNEAKAGAAKRAQAGETFHENLEMGNSFLLLKDDEDPERAMPRKGSGGLVLRTGHSFPRIPVPPLKDRVHKSKYVFRDISGRGVSNWRLVNPLVTADFDGVTRPATNTETLYRSWHTRYWAQSRVSKGSTKGMPFADVDANKARKKGGFRVPR